MRHTLPGLLVAVVFILGTGCEKSGSRPPVSLTPTQLSPDTIFRVYSRGKEELGNIASAFYIMRIWELSQSAQLETQTLGKLSTAPWRLKTGEDSTTNKDSALLYPLLAGVVWNESYFEIRRAPNQAAEYVLAIHLDTPHQYLWETNLAAVVKSLTGIQPVPLPDRRFGWLLRRQDPPRRIELARIGQWILVSAGPEKNSLLDEISARIGREHTPYVPQSPDDWLEADVDLSRLKGWLPQDWNRPANLPKISLAVTGDGAHVLAHAVLSFPEPLHLPLQSWNIPTNLIHQPLVDFTVARGFEPWLASWKCWKELEMGLPPDQICSWALPFGPVETYFAVPLPDATAQVRALTGHLLNKANPWLAARGYIGFRADPTANGVIWGNSPSISPFVKSVNANGAGGVALGGLIPETTANVQTNLFYYHPTFPELLEEISGRTNLVYYHWELTGARIHSCLYIGQFLSVILRQPPLPMDSVSAVWLKTIMPRLGNCTTTISVTGANQLSFTRRSSLGFSAAELNLLGFWLESPRFPFGL